MEEFESKLPMNLQFFAEEGADNAEDNVDADAENSVQADNEDTFTQEQVDQMIGERLEKECSTMKEDITNQIKQDMDSEKDKAKKLEEMSDVERANFERDEALKQKAEYEAKIARIDTGKQVSKMLADKGINANEEVIDLIVQDGMKAEDIKNGVNSFSELVNSLVDEKVKEKMSGRTPNNFGSGNVEADNSIGKKLAEQANKANKSTKSIWD